MNKRLNLAAAAAALLACGPVLAQPAQSPLSPAVRAAIAKPMDALDAALAKEAAAPPPASDREKLESMGRIDQSWRYYMGELKLDGLSAEDQKAAYAAIAARTEPIDRENLGTVMSLRPMDGWYSISAYGEEAAEAALHIVSHGSLSAQKSVLPALTQLAARGEVDRQQYAALYDRVQVGLGKPQRFGTQFNCVDHRPVPYPLEDEGRVEALRKAMKIPNTFAEQVKGLADRDVRC